MGTFVVLRAFGKGCKVLRNNNSRVVTSFLRNSRSVIEQTFLVTPQTCVATLCGGGHVPQSHFHTTCSTPVGSGKDYYKTLGVSPDANSKDIKKAYYQLAKKYHPDTNKGDKEAQKKFQEVSEAYECLSDESRRKQYDAFGSNAASSGGGSSSGHPFGAGFGNAWNFQSSIDPEELFRTIFGDKAWASGSSAQGNPFDFGHTTPEFSMKLTFVEAAKGVEKDMNINIMDTCDNCHGSGNQPGTTTDRCPQCSGTGMETVSTGPFMMRSTCRRCHGKGFWNKNPCLQCTGSGQTRQRQTVKVPVPAGIEDGQTVRMPISSGREIFITFRIEPSDYFRRQGSDVHTDAKISLAQSALGGAIRVQGVYEDLNVQIPNGTVSHTRMRLAGKGIKKVSGYGYGDHYIHIRIDVPKKLDEKQKALLQAYAEMENDTPGTINGLTYAKDGNKVVMEDPEGMVNDIREAIQEQNQHNGSKDKA